MKEINISKILVSNRRERGITQDELASYIGVTKASVSKWETGQSYPDITYLPQLATYFNISIDALLGYAPQMTKEQIKRLYHELAARFATQPFDEVLSACREIIKKYYSCFPLLLQMAVLLINHHMLTPETDQQKEILAEVIDLCERVKTESDDIYLSREAVTIEGTCYLMMQQSGKVLDLFGEDIRPLSQDTEMIAQAYLIMGKTDKAKEVTQISMYQHLLYLMGMTTFYLALNAKNLEKVDEILTRAMGIATLFKLDQLHPNTMAQLYLAAADCYCRANRTEPALDMLQRYTDLCLSKFFPYSLHGDDYFDSIGNWFEDFDLGISAPRSEGVIRDSMVQAVMSNPVFANLSNNPKYQVMIKKLERMATR
jgi:transcriptional regulator with XRE-family HTH domain